MAHENALILYIFWFTKYIHNTLENLLETENLTKMSVVTLVNLIISCMIYYFR